MSKHDDIIELVKRYEQTLAENRSVYFDADEFGDIATYYDAIDDIESAKELIEIGLRIHPESETLLVKKAKILTYENNYSEALQILETSISSGYDFDLYMVKVECLLQLKRHKEAVDFLTTIIENEDNQDIQAVYAEIGLLFLEADYFDDAIDFFENSLKIDPENTEVLSDLSYTYETLGDFDNAIITCNKILDIDPYNYDAWLNLGKLYTLGSRYDKAVDAFDFALTINDDDINILKLKGHCLSLLGRTMDAIQIFKELLEQDPDDSSLFLLLAECYANLNLFNEAIEYLDLYKEIAGETIEYFIKKATVFSLMDKLEYALTVADEAIKKFSNQSLLFTLSGDIKFDLKDYLGAEADYKQAYSLDADSFDLLDKLAITEIKLENYDLAIKYTEELLILEPENIELKQRIALLYFEVDHKQQFNDLINSFNDDELIELFNLFYNPERPELFDREQLIAALNEAREYRILFKNLKY